MIPVSSPLVKMVLFINGMLQRVEVVIRRMAVVGVVAVAVVDRQVVVE